MELTLGEYLLYFLNSLIFLLSTILFSYYLCNLEKNTTIINTINCENIGFISFMILLNSIVNFLTIINFKIIGTFTTIAIFSYSVWNIENIFETCQINNNIVFLYYICNLIINSIIILIYSVYYTRWTINYFLNKPKCFNCSYEKQINLVYDVNNAELYE
jgi:hypothetical protein